MVAVEPPRTVNGLLSIWMSALVPRTAMTWTAEPTEGWLSVTAADEAVRVEEPLVPDELEDMPGAALGDALGLTLVAESVDAGGLLDEASPVGAALAEPVGVGGTVADDAAAVAAAAAAAAASSGSGENGSP